MSGRPLVVATRNPAKLAELARLLAGRGWQLLDLDEAGVAGDLPEPGPGYRENAIAKAVAALSATGLPALADDSGIEVAALEGWPGPHSARWAGGSDADRLRGVLEAVALRTPHDRRARYVAVAAVAAPSREPITATGTCAGTLVEPRGVGGFGYDPAFLSDDLGRTFAEVTPVEKDAVSHRGRALAALIELGVL